MMDVSLLRAGGQSYGLDVKCVSKVQIIVHFIKFAKIRDFNCNQFQPLFVFKSDFPSIACSFWFYTFRMAVVILEIS